MASVSSSLVKVQILTVCLIHVCLIHVPVETAVDPLTAAKTVSVITNLVKLFSSDEERVKDLTAAEEVVRGLTFDLFNEKISCKVLKGINIEDYRNVVDRFATRFSIPSDIQDSLLDGLYADENFEIIIDFKFEKGKTGGFTYGRVATVRNQGKIDMAYSVYHLEFKLSPSEIEHVKKKKFLGFTIGKKVWREYRERNLSIREKDEMQTYFMQKAISGFKEQYSALIEAEAVEYCLEDDCGSPN